MESDRMEPAFLWKPHIIGLTEYPEARASRIDASFFPPVTEARLREWEQEREVRVPEDLAGFLLQSDGLEAQTGWMWPVLPLPEWEVFFDGCQGAQPWVRFGRSREGHYWWSPGCGTSIYRTDLSGGDPEFFASGFHRYLELLFRARG